MKLFSGVKFPFVQAQLISTKPNDEELRLIACLHDIRFFICTREFARERFLTSFRKFQILILWQVFRYIRVIKSNARSAIYSPIQLGRRR